MTQDRARFAAAAAQLARGRVIDGLCWGLGISALVALAVAPQSLGPVPLGLIAAIGVAEAVLAARVAFRAALFRAMAQGPGAPDLGAMDRALQPRRVGPAAGAGQPVAARIAGARRLLRWQAVALAAQVAVLLLGLALRG